MRKTTGLFLIFLIPFIQLISVLIIFEWISDLYPLSKGDIHYGILIYFSARMYMTLALFICVLNFLWKFNWKSVVISIFLLLVFDSFFYYPMESRPNRVLFILVLTNSAQLFSIFISYVLHTRMISIKPNFTQNEQLVDHLE
jgi:hypothetical protein